MDPKRKKIYIATIAASLLLAVGILWWGGIIGGGAAQPAETTLPLPTPDAPRATRSAEGDGTYSAPAVFPGNSRFDTSVLDLSTFKSFKTYTPPQVTDEEIGREDPFKNY